jgi:hypothetical protein
MSGGAASRDGTSLSCPSAQPGMEGARIIGVLSGTATDPRIGYLKQSAEVTPEIMETLGGIDPTHVFRFSAKCAGGACAQFGNGQCSLGKRIVDRLDAVTDTLPSCLIRQTCRWFAEQGAAACFRCPQIVTKVDQQDRLSQALAPQPETLVEARV